MVAERVNRGGVELGRQIRAIMRNFCTVSVRQCPAVRKTNTYVRKILCKAVRPFGLVVS